VEVQRDVTVFFSCRENAESFADGMMFSWMREYEELDRNDYPPFFCRGARFTFYVERYARIHGLPLYYTPYLIREEVFPGCEKKRRFIVKRYK
jgi:hypothetical protein